MLFAGVSPAKMSRSQAVKQDSTESEAPYIPKCLELLASVCQDTQFLRTSQASLVVTEGDGSQDFYMTWPRSGTMQNGTVYRLPTLAPPITEIGCGSLPTPNTMDHRGFLPTPTTSNAKGAARNRFYGSSTCRGNLGEVLRSAHTDSIYPNPDFVEQMMGFPVGHTDLNS